MKHGAAHPASSGTPPRVSGTAAALLRVADRRGRATSKVLVGDPAELDLKVGSSPCRLLAFFEQMPRPLLQRGRHEHVHRPRRVRRVQAFPLQQNRDPLAIEASPRKQGRGRRSVLDLAQAASPGCTTPHS